MSITRINEFRAAPEQTATLREFLRSVIDVIERAPGCQRCELLSDQEDAAHLVIIEHWDSVASHKAAATRIPPEQLAQVRPLLAEPPKGRYFDPVR